MATVRDRPSKSLTVYAEELRQWLQLTRQVHAANQAMMQMHYQMLSRPAHPQTQTSGYSQDSADSTHPAGSRRPTTESNVPRTFPMSAGTECQAAPLWKRFVAELIDFIFLLIVKFFVSYLLVNYVGLRAIQVMDFDYALLNGELDLNKFMDMSVEIFAVELIHRILVSLYEAFCLAYVTNIIPPGGSTPGKKIMGLVVVSCEEVFSLGHGRFLITDIGTPSLYNALIRSGVKNFSLSFMVPTSLTVFMFDHRRAVYDLISNTMVIENQTFTI